MAGVVRLVVNFAAMNPLFPRLYIIGRGAPSYPFDCNSKSENCGRQGTSSSSGARGAAVGGEILIIVVVRALGGVVGLPRAVENAFVFLFRGFGHQHRRNSSPPPRMRPMQLPDTLRR
jgi:hypothetical protein